MNDLTYRPIAARPAPAQERGLGAWIEQHLVSDWVSALQTLILGGLLLVVVMQIIQWAWIKAFFGPDDALCHAVDGGACWGWVAEQYRNILFGSYPQSEQWRALVASLLLLGLLASCGSRRFWRARLLPLSLGVVLVATALMAGGVGGLQPVSSALWGGLPLTLLLTWLSWMMSFPVALVLALGLNSKRAVICGLSSQYVTLMRSLPLIAVLFVAFFVLPLCLPQGMQMDVLVRLWGGLTLVSAAGMASILRSGLQSVPQGQSDAAAALGLGYWQTLRKIILPQAMARVMPGMMRHLTEVFRDTTLVGILAFHDLTGAVRLALSPAVDGHLHLVEGYALVALFYLAVGFWMSRCQSQLAQPLDDQPVHEVAVRPLGCLVSESHKVIKS